MLALLQSCSLNLRKMISKNLCLMICSPIYTMFTKSDQKLCDELEEVVDDKCQCVDVMMQV